MSERKRLPGTDSSQKALLDYQRQQTGSHSQLGRSFFAFVPLAIAGLEFPWLLWITFGYLFMAEQLASTAPTARRNADVMGIAPMVVGVVVSIISLFFVPSKKSAFRIIAAVGGLACIAWYVVIFAR